jgi:hypothetical protein
MGRIALHLGCHDADQFSHGLRDVRLLRDNHNGAHRDAFRQGSPTWEWVE